MSALAARYVLLTYVYLVLGSYLVGILVSYGNTLWPTALGAEYPSRPLVQIGMACAMLPQFVILCLWCMKTRSRTIKVLGSCKFALWNLQTYITLADNRRIHGLLGFLYNVFEVGWMVTVISKAHSDAKVVRYRKIILLAYAGTFLLSIHQLSRQLTTGFGFEEFKTLRGVNFLLGIWFEYLSKDDFEGINLSISWVESYSV